MIKILKISLLLCSYCFLMSMEQPTTQKKITLILVTQSNFSVEVTPEGRNEPLKWKTKEEYYNSSGDIDWGSQDSDSETEESHDHITQEKTIPEQKQLTISTNFTVKITIKNQKHPFSFSFTTKEILKSSKRITPNASSLRTPKIDIESLKSHRKYFIFVTIVPSKQIECVIMNASNHKGKTVKKTNMET